MEYASPQKLQNEKVKKLMDMGFTEVQAIDALNKVGGDENEAIQLLLG